jgi:hypothetical protein
MFINDSSSNNVPVNKGEKEVERLVFQGDSLLSLKTDSSLRQALEAYQGANQLAKAYQIPDTSYNIGNKISTLTDEIDSLFQMHVNDAEGYINAKDEEDYPRIINCLEKALALKDDPKVKSTLDTYKNK